MSESGFMAVVRIYRRYWKWIVFFCLFTLLISGVLNFGFRKPPNPKYQANGSIDVNGVVLMNKTIPTISDPSFRVQSFLDQAAKELNVDQEKFHIRVEIDTPNVVKVNGISTSRDVLDQYVNRILQIWAGVYRDKYKVIKDDVLISKLGDTVDKNLQDKNGVYSPQKILAAYNDIIKDQANEQTQISNYDGMLEKNEFNTLSNVYMLQQANQREKAAAGLEKEQYTRKIIDIETKIDLYNFSKDYYQQKQHEAEVKVKKIKEMIPVYSSLYDNEMINSKTIVTNASVSSLTVIDTRGRTVMISCILAFILVCGLILGREIIFPRGKKEMRD